MAQKDELIVEGFCFTSKEEAELAKTELEKIKLLEERMNYRDGALVLSVYNKAIENRTFRTPIGYQYLYHIREQLLKRGVSGEELRAIPLYVHFAPIDTTGKAKKEAPKKQVHTRPSVSLIGSVVLNIVLTILVAAMFLITLYSDNPNILNYKTQVINEYASWEQELRDKEAELREWEKELQSASDSQNGQN